MCFSISTSSAPSSAAAVAVESNNWAPVVQLLELSKRIANDPPVPVTVWLVVLLTTATTTLCFLQTHHFQIDPILDALHDVTHHVSMIGKSFVIPDANQRPLIHDWIPSSLNYPPMNAGLAFKQAIYQPTILL
jgi:hypothetical protein